MADLAYALLLIGGFAVLLLLVRVGAAAKARSVDGAVPALVLSVQPRLDRPFAALGASRQTCASWIASN